MQRDVSSRQRSVGNVRRRSGFVIGALTVVLVVSGCSSSGSAHRSSTPPSTAGAAAHQFYVSVGDSYAAGFQPTTARAGGPTRNGFAYQTVTAANAKGYDYELVNFGCSGATTASVLHAPGCKPAFLGPGASSYAPMTQAAAAEAFLSAHRGQVGLITVSLGGNDIFDCSSTADAVGCVTKALGTVDTNLTTLLGGLRAAAGPDTRIVGTTYPDVLLFDLLSKNAAKQNIAKLSVLAFQSLINPQLKRDYEVVHAQFVDVTQATGGYDSLTAMTTLPPYGTIPVPVAKICQLTYFCQFNDIHPRTAGYALIAKLVVSTLANH